MWENKKKQQRKRYENNLTAWKQYQQEHPESPFIEGQRDMQKLAYGGGFLRVLDTWILGGDKAGQLTWDHALAASKNACEVIALYNALTALGKEASFPDLLADFEKKGILFGGLFGTSMRAVFKWLEKRMPGKSIRFSAGQTKNYVNRLKEAEKTANLTCTNPDSWDCRKEELPIYLVSFWNKRGNPFRGIHTVCITREQEPAVGKLSGYTIHNLYGDNHCITGKTLEEALLHSTPDSALLWVVGLRK